MNILYFLASFCFFIWLVRNVFFWVFLWQIKEYRLDRIFAHVKETESGKKLFVSQFLLIKLLLIGGYIVPILDGRYLFFYQLLITAVFISEAVFVVQEIIFRRLRRPTLTIKSFFIFFFTIFSFTVFFRVPLIERFLWLLILDRLIPFFVAFFVYAFSVPGDFIKDLQIEKATKKLQEHKNVLIIAISGSYGKSSTKEYVSQILERKFNVLKTQGSNNTPIGIAKTVLSGLKNATEIFVVELGSYKRGEVAQLCQIVHPQIGITTGISNQHLSLFGSLENIIQTEYELIEALPKSGVSLFNGNDRYVKSLYSKAKIKKVLYTTNNNSKIEYATGARYLKSEISAANIVVGKQSVSFRVSINKKILELRAPVLGGHNVENILPGIFLGNYLGMSERQIKQAVSSLKPLQKTMVGHHIDTGAFVIDDTFNVSPNAVLAALEYMKIYKGKKILVLHPMIELGTMAKEEHVRIGKAIGMICDYVFLTNKNYWRDIRKGVQLAKSRCIIRASRPLEVASFIKATTQNGDIVIFEGKEATMALHEVL